MSRSKIFLLLCVFFVAGVFLGSLFSVSEWVLFLLLGFFISSVFLCRRNEFLKTLLVLLIFVLIGFIRVEHEKVSDLEIRKINKLDGQLVFIKGKISSIPEIKNGKQKIVVGSIKKAKDDNYYIDGKIIVYLDRYPEYNMNDIVRLYGKTKVPEDFGGFKYREYLLSKGIYYVMYYPRAELEARNKKGFYFQSARFRKFLNSLIKNVFPEPHAGIISAMTLGIKSGVSSDILNIFNKTGTRHIIAVSGLHIAVVSMVLMHVLIAIGFKRGCSFYFSIAGIAFFVFLIGFPSSAVRAAVMGGLVLSAVKIGRLYNAVNAVVFAAALMLLLDPNLLKYDTGFQLSFLAVLGIICIFPRLDNMMKKCHDFLNIKTLFLITVSAQVAILPIIISSFGKFSLMSVFANILVMPFVPVVMTGGFLIMAVGMINLHAAQILSFPIWLILSYQIEVIKFFSNVSFASFAFDVDYYFSAFYYVVLALFLFRGGLFREVLKK